MTLIVVAGATGNQGGAVVDSCLRKGYSVRGITRKIDSEKADALRQKGVEVVQADLEDKSSFVNALRGADGLFVLTDFWHTMSVEREYKQGVNQIDAAREAGVAHVVLSTLEGVQKVVGDRMKKVDGYACAHFDSKDMITGYAKSSGCNVTYLYTSFYYDNFIDMTKPRKGEDGKYHLAFNMGNTPMPMVAVKDIGNAAANCFEAGSSVYDQNVYVVGDKRTIYEYAETFSRVFGKQFVYDKLTSEQYAKLGFPGAAELANMFEFKRDYESDFPRDVAKAKEFTPEISSFDEWLEEHRGDFNFD